MVSVTFGIWLSFSTPPFFRLVSMKFNILFIDLHRKAVTVEKYLLLELLYSPWSSIYLMMNIFRTEYIAKEIKGLPLFYFIESRPKKEDDAVWTDFSNIYLDIVIEWLRTAHRKDTII